MTLRDFWQRLQDVLALDAAELSEGVKSDAAAADEEEEAF